MKKSKPADTRSSLPAPNSIRLEDHIDEEDWYNVFQIIHHHVMQFKKLLKFQGTSTRNAQYLSQWMTMYADVSEEKNDDEDMSWETVAAIFFKGELLGSFKDFTEHIIGLVPSVKVIMKVIEENERVFITINEGWKTLAMDEEQTKAHNMQTDKEKRQNKTRKDMIDLAKNDDDDREQEIFNMELRKQVNDMEKKLDSETMAIRSEIRSAYTEIKELKTDLKTDLLSAIKTGIAEVIGGDPKTYNEELKISLKEGERQYSKLQGDLNTSEKKINDLRSQAETIKKLADDATNKAKKVYTEHKLEFEAKNTEILTKMTEALVQVTNATRNTRTHEAPPSGVPSEAPPPLTTPYYQKHYADEYRIGSEVYRIQTKKFIEDSTPIICNSSNEMLGTYDLLKEVAGNYGILLQNRDDIGKWDKVMNAEPPTCPYNEIDFTTKKQYQECYSKMKIALATKLKKHVEFGPNFIAADIAVTNYSNDGYRMLYDLMVNAHPQLKRDSAQQPHKPKFNGDINEFMFKFQNYYTYKASRSKPHYYDDYEKAEAVMYAIKESRYYRDIKHGMDEAENLLRLWKAAGSNNAEFPTELELDSIAGTILQYYIERNRNPLPQSRGRSREERQNINATHGNGDRGATIRAANGYNGYRRRYGNNNRNNSRSTSRNSSRSNSYSRSNDRNRDDRAYTPTRNQNGGRATRRCDYCNGIHYVDTVGCPKLLDYINIHEYVSNANPNEINRIVEDMQREREQSRSRSRSQSSRMSQQRGRSNNSERSRSGSRN